MIIGALLQQQERDKRLSVHCRSPLADFQLYSMDELMGLGKPCKPSLSKTKIKESSNQEIDNTNQILTDKNTTDEEKIIRIMQKPKTQRHFLEVAYLNQELEKIEYFQNLKHRCKDKRYREAINVLSYKFVKKGEFIIKKNEIGNEFYIILSGSCFVLDEDETITPSARLSMASGMNQQSTAVQSPTIQMSPSKKSSIPNSVGFSNFRSALQCWNDNNDDQSQLSQDEEYEPEEDSKSQFKESKQFISQTPTLQSITQTSYRSSIIKIPLINRKESFMHSLFKSSIPNLKIIKMLTKGDAFGEKAILSTFQKRTAYVQAKEDCHLLYLTKQEYLTIIGNKKTQQIEKISNFLSRFKFLEGWQAGDLKSLSGYFYKEKLNKGEYVFKEGDISQNIYIMMKGQASIQKEVSFQIHQVENLIESRFKNIQKVIEIAELNEGEIFGEESSVKYESKRCFTVQIKSMKVVLIRINAQKLLDKLWDPNSKRVYLQQVHQKLKWRSDRYEELVKMRLKQFQGQESIDEKLAKIKPEIIKITDTPDKEMVLNQQFLQNNKDSSNSKINTQILKKNENIILVDRKPPNQKQPIIDDINAVKEQYMKKFPLAWHLRQQELILKSSFCSSPSSKISDNIQNLRPITAKIEEKRAEIFNQRIKSGTLHNIYQSNQEQQKNQNQQKLRQTTSIDINTSNPSTPILNRIQSAQLIKQKSYSISHSPKNYFTPLSKKNSQFTDELNQIFSNSQNLSRFHPSSKRNSILQIPYFGQIQETQTKEDMIDQSYSEIIKQISSRVSPRLMSQGSIEEKPQQIQKKPERFILKKVNTLDEKEINQKQLEFIKQNSSLLRGYSATLKRQNFFHTMSIEEDQEEKRLLYLRKYLEENKEQKKILKSKRNSAAYHLAQAHIKPKIATIAYQSKSSNIVNQSSLSYANKDKKEDQNKSNKQRNSLIQQFSLFEDEYSKYSKEEQERLRNQEKRFDIELDKNLSAQTSIIEKDMMEILSVKGQQIAKDISQDLKNKNHDFILKLFQKKEKTVLSSARLQRTLDYTRILKDKGKEKQKIQEQKKKLSEQIELNQNQLSQKSNDLGFNFVKINRFQKNSLQDTQKKEEINNKTDIYKGKDSLQKSPSTHKKQIQIQSQYSSPLTKNRVFSQTTTIFSTPNQQQSRPLTSKSSSQKKLSYIPYQDKKIDNLINLYHISLNSIKRDNSTTLSNQFIDQDFNILLQTKLKQIAQYDAQAIEDHKKIIESQTKKQKKQTNAFEIISKLIFENKADEISSNQQQQKSIIQPKQQRPQSTSVYDPKSKQLIIQRQTYYMAN